MQDDIAGRMPALQRSASGAERSNVTRNEWIHDWNSDGPMAIPAGRHVLLNDETLRDGLQNPSIQDPTIKEKIEILHLMESLQIDSVNIGLPGAGPRAAQHVEALRGKSPRTGCASSRIAR